MKELTLSKHLYELTDARAFGRWLKKIDVPIEEVQVGDLVCDGFNPWFIASITEKEDCFEISDINENCGTYPKKLKYSFRIVPRNILAEHPYD